MEYKVFVNSDVWNKHRQIEDYCLYNFDNKKFAQKLHKDILRTANLLVSSPFMYPKINNMHRVVLSRKYLLYYSIENDCIYIEDLKGRGQY